MVNFQGKHVGPPEESKELNANQIIALGPIAVPALIVALGKPTQREQARTILIKMGYRAVLPLIAVLSKTDPALLQETVAILVAIGDGRALPYLRHIAGSSHGDPEVKRIVTDFFSRRPIAKPAVPEFSPFFHEALRYRSDAPSVQLAVQEERFAAGAMLWHWDATTEVGPALVGWIATQADKPWHDLMTERLCLDGLLRNPDDLACRVLLSQCWGSPVPAEPQAAIRMITDTIDAARRTRPGILSPP